MELGIVRRQYMPRPWFAHRVAVFAFGLLAGVLLTLAAEAL